MIGACDESDRNFSFVGRNFCYAHFVTGKIIDRSAELFRPFYYFDGTFICEALENFGSSGVIEFVYAI